MGRCRRAIADAVFYADAAGKTVAADGREGAYVGVIFLAIFFLISVFIVGLVLLQEGKGGGLTGMSTGMDGVMGAKNPLRRLTAYLFAFFVLLCLGINIHFHWSSNVDSALPAGANLPAAASPANGGALPAALPEGALRPEAGEDAGGEIAPALPIRPEGDAATPAEPIATSGSDAAESLTQAVDELEQAAETPAREVSEAAAALRPETTAEAEEPPVSVQPPADDQ